MGSGCKFCNGEVYFSHSDKCGNEVTQHYQCKQCDARTAVTVEITIELLISLIRQNKKILAIKMHRTLTDEGLKESKEKIDSLCDIMAKLSPIPF
jgi:ribosomal protein L7/L12